MMVKDEAVDPRIPEQRLQKREANRIIGAQQLLHDLFIREAVTGAMARPLTGLPFNLCSLGFGRVKLIGQAFAQLCGTDRRIGWRSGRVSIGCLRA